MPSLLDHPEPANAHLAVPSDVANLLSFIERAATDPQVDADKMERLVGLYERLMAHRAKAAFTAAFAEMQSELPEIAENGEIKVGDTVRSRYAKFEDINDVVKPILKTHGFSLMFKPRATDDGQILMQAVLMHRDGHSEDADLRLPADTSGSKNSVQSMGSSGQYAKRYLIVPMLNITTRGVDDDGRAGGSKLIDQDQVMELQKIITDNKIDQKAFLNAFKASNLTQIAAARFDEAKSMLERKAASMKKESAK
jgi:hypothetical protein